MGLQFAGFFAEWLGGCCPLPETEQRQTPVHPTAVATALAAPLERRTVARGISKTCENTGRLCEFWKCICNYWEQMVSPHGEGDWKRRSSVKTMANGNSPNLSVPQIDPVWGKYSAVM